MNMLSLISLSSLSTMPVLCLSYPHAKRPAWKLTKTFSNFCDSLLPQNKDAHAIRGTRDDPNCLKKAMPTTKMPNAFAICKFAVLASGSLHSWVYSLCQNGGCSPNATAFSLLRLTILFVGKIQIGFHSCKWKKPSVIDVSLWKSSLWALHPLFRCTGSSRRKLQNVYATRGRLLLQSRPKASLFLSMQSEPSFVSLRACISKEWSTQALSLPHWFGRLFPLSQLLLQTDMQYLNPGVEAVAADDHHHLTKSEIKDHVIEQDNIDLENVGYKAAMPRHFSPLAMMSLCFCLTCTWFVDPFLFQCVWSSSRSGTGSSIGVALLVLYRTCLALRLMCAIVRKHLQQAQSGHFGWEPLALSFWRAGLAELASAFPVAGAQCDDPMASYECLELIKSQITTLLWFLQSNGELSFPTSMDGLVSWDGG